MTEAAFPKNTNPNDARHEKVWLRREQVMYMLDISMTTLRNYETRSRDKLPRHKSNTAEGIVYYDAHEMCEFYHKMRLRKEFGDGEVPTSSTPGKGVNGNLEKARLTKAQAEAQELKNEIARGEVAPIQVLQDALANVCGQIAAILGSVPSSLRKRYSWLKSSQLDEIATAIAKAQNAAADVQITLPDEPELEDNADTDPTNK